MTSSRTNNRVSIYLYNLVLPHKQLCVAMSHATTVRNLKVLAATWILCYNDIKFICKYMAQIAFPLLIYLNYEA